MRLGRRSAPPREPHPDPQVERQIQHVMALQRLVKSAEVQVQLYQTAIKNAHERQEKALSLRLLTSYPITEYQLRNVSQQVQTTIKHAEEGIREQARHH
jgi:hypothetical protein